MRPVGCSIVVGPDTRVDQGVFRPGPAHRRCRRASERVAPFSACNACHRIRARSTHSALIRRRHPSPRSARRVATGTTRVCQPWWCRVGSVQCSSTRAPRSNGRVVKGVVTHPCRVLDLPWIGGASHDRADFPHVRRPFCVPHPSAVARLGDAEEPEHDLLELGQLG